MQKDRAILHADMNNFFASVECVIDPRLKGKPVAVCGNVEERHGIIMARNSIAKSFGVNAAEPIWKAKLKCPDLVEVKNAHYDEYEKYSRLARNIYRKYTDRVEPFGIDECWIDVTNSQLLFGTPIDIANEIKEKIKKELGLTVSVGVSFNKVFAKFGSDYKKPDAITVINRENFKDIVWPCDASEIIGVGRRTREILRKYNINTIGDIANEKPEMLYFLLGENGINLYRSVNGLDDDEVSIYEEIDEVKSISHGITTIRDLTNNDEVWNVLFELSQEIAYKLRKKNLRTSCIQLSVRDSELVWVQFQKKLTLSEQSAINIAKIAFDLFKKKYVFDLNIHSISIQASCLIDENTPEPIGLFNSKIVKDKIEMAEECMEDINLRYGNNLVKNASLMSHNNLPEERRKIKYNDEQKHSDKI